MGMMIFFTLHFTHFFSSFHTFHRNHSLRPYALWMWTGLYSPFWKYENGKAKFLFLRGLYIQYFPPLGALGMHSCAGVYKYIHKSEQMFILLNPTFCIIRFEPTIGTLQYKKQTNMRAQLLCDSQKICSYYKVSGFQILFAKI